MQFFPLKPDQWHRCSFSSDLGQGGEVRQSQGPNVARVGPVYPAGRPPVTFLRFCLLGWKTYYLYIYIYIHIIYYSYILCKETSLHYSRKPCQSHIFVGFGFCRTLVIYCIVFLEYIGAADRGQKTHSRVFDHVPTQTCQQPSQAKDARNNKSIPESHHVCNVYKAAVLTSDCH